MRTLSAKTTTAIAEHGTAPRHLIYLEFSAPLYLSTREEVTWTAHTWTKSGIDLGPLVERAGGANEISLALPNSDNAAGALVLGESVRGKVCKVWTLYGDAPFAIEDAVLLFDGVVDAIPEIGQRVRLTAVTQGARTARAPRLPIGPPWCNHLAPRGTRFEVAGEVFILESRNG